MINLLINSFAPVAILILIGYISAKKSIFTNENSVAIIKYVGVVAVPALTLNIILSIILMSFLNPYLKLLKNYYHDVYKFV